MALMQQRKEKLESVKGVAAVAAHQADKKKHRFLRRKPKDMTLAVTWPSVPRTLVSCVEFCAFAFVFGSLAFGVAYLTTQVVALFV